MSIIAAVGLDAAEWALVETRLGEGDVPDLTALRQKRARCTLRDSEGTPLLGPAPTA